MRYSAGITAERLNALARQIGAAPLLELFAGSQIVGEGRLPESWLTRPSDGVIQMDGEWRATGTSAAGRGAKITRFRVSGRGQWIDGSVSLPDEGGDAFMRELVIAEGQRCAVEMFRVIAGNR